MATRVEGAVEKENELTIPQYDLLSRRKLAPAFPPVLTADRVPTNFELTYVGSKGIRTRLRRAISKYAAAQLGFWQFTIVIALLGLLAVPISARGMPAWVVVVLILIFAVGALVMPARQYFGARRAADSYGLEGESYSSDFDEAHLLWQTPAATYEVPWDSIDKVISEGDITIITIRSSRAICVLPDELLTAQVHARLAEIDRRRRNLS